MSHDLSCDCKECSCVYHSQVDEYLADPNTFPTNRMITQAYKDGVERGVFVQPRVYPHFLPNRKEQVMYFVQPSDLLSYDPTTKSHDQVENSSESSEPVQAKSNI